MTHGWMHANNLIQALQNAPKLFNLRLCRAFDLVSILIGSLVLGNDLAGAEPLQVLSVTVNQAMEP